MKKFISAVIALALLLSVQNVFAVYEVVFCTYVSGKITGVIDPSLKYSTADKTTFDSCSRALNTVNTNLILQSITSAYDGAKATVTYTFSDKKLTL